jgi:SAM-dependent methyltransferase
MGVVDICNRVHGICLRRIAPTLRHPQRLYEEALKAHITPQTVWLDMGCGHQILPAWRQGAVDDERALVETCRMVVGMDYDRPSLQRHRSITHTVRGDITDLPFRDGTFNLVTANMVVEHLAEPERQFREVERALMPGGLFIFHTPNALGYYVMLARLVPERIKPRLVSMIDARPEEDIFRTFYRANSPARIQALADRSGFDVQAIHMIASPGIAAFMLVPPLGLLQIGWIKLSMARTCRSLRSNIITVLRKREGRVDTMSSDEEGRARRAESAQSVDPLMRAR